MSLLTLSLIFANIILLVLGQTLWKLGLDKVGFSFTLSGIIKTIFTPLVFLGLCVYIVATVIWFYVLSKTEISTAYPLQSLCYVLAALVGIFVFRENVSAVKWIGLFMISVLLISRG